MPHSEKPSLAGEGMDTTYVTIMLVVFLVITGLAVDVGYLYVGEEELQSAAESAALAGAQAMQQRVLATLKTDPSKLPAVSGDPVQQQAREAAMEAASGRHAAAARIELKNDNGNALTADNDITVGFWSAADRGFTPGKKPANAIQVRTRRTAESSSVGMGALGTFLARISGTESFASTPVAVAALVTGTRANISLCAPAAEGSPVYPELARIAERKISAAPEVPLTARFRFTSLRHPLNALQGLSELACTELPPQEVCGHSIYLAPAKVSVLADVAAMMYDPAVDPANKEYDGKGRLAGWWVVVPVTDCDQSADDTFETRPVSRYALIRITRVCAGGPAGCAASGRTAPPASACAGGGEGVYFDRISTVGCGSPEHALFPGLKPVLVQ